MLESQNISSLIKTIANPWPRTQSAVPPQAVAYMLTSAAAQFGKREREDGGSSGDWGREGLDPFGWT
jgi:hypothetical protein